MDTGTIEEMKVLDLRKSTLVDIARLGRVVDVHTVLLSPDNAVAWAKVCKEDIGVAVVVPSGMPVFTGQTDFSGDFLRTQTHPLRCLVVGQAFLGEATPTDIETHIEQLLLSGDAFVHTAAAAKALCSRLKLVGRRGRIVVVPPSHLRWIGESWLGRETLTPWHTGTTLIVIGSLHIADNVSPDLLEHTLRVFFCSGHVTGPPACLGALERKRSVIVELNKEEVNDAENA